MTLHPRLTRATVALVKRFETFQPHAEPTPDGGWSIGYGHTRSAREGARVDAADAEALLVYDLDAAARAVERALFAPVSQRQFEALTALCFNVGEPAFLRSSALARVNAGAELDAADEIERWRRAELGAGTQVVDALVRRRAAEKAHFLGLPDGEAKWPSAQLRPLAAPGGESQEPATAVECPSSAALTAANGVQARLRRLIPDEQHDALPIAAEALDLEDAPHPPASPTEIASPAPVAAEPTRLETQQVEPPVAWEPTPPPFDPPSPSPAAEPQPQPTVLAPRSEPPAEQVTPKIAAPATPGPARGPRKNPRLPYVLLGLLGAALFVGAVVMIIAGRPGLLDLGLGVVGVLVAVPALYGLLGAQRGAAGRDALEAPFHNAPAHTK